MSGGYTGPTETVDLDGGLKAEWTLVFMRSLLAHHQNVKAEISYLEEAAVCFGWLPGSYISGTHMKSARACNYVRTMDANSHTRLPITQRLALAYCELETTLGYLERHFLILTTSETNEKVSLEIRDLVNKVLQ